MTEMGVALTFGSAFLNFLLARLASFGSFAWGELKEIYYVDENLRKLERTFFKIQELAGVIDSCPLRFYGGNNAWQLWFEDMRKLSYDADALLDRVGLLISDQCAKHSNPEQQQQQAFTMILSSLSNFGIPHAISNMQKELDALAKEMESLMMIEKIKIDARLPTSGISLPFPPSSVHNSFTSMVGVGREYDKRHIVDLLGKVGSETSGNFSVIFVMGMGGIGKTAIARHVYDDDSVGRSFNLRVWVSVSVEFDMVRITKSMIEVGSSTACHLSDLESLQLKLEGLLRGKKFLLVLDDYWSEKFEDWDTLSSPFKFCDAGSKVIVTTRSMRVSSVVCSSHAYKLELLSDDDCWEVIKQRSSVSVESSRNLESVGREIARKCNGIPLTATTLGNMLRCKPTQEEEWRLVLRKELWAEEAMSLRLIQSYIHLPPHLQKCFAYCSIFPQGHEFDMDELALLWVAEGYVNVEPTSLGDLTLEDLARGYFKDLCSRFVFQQCENGSSSLYNMHDLMHGMAQLVSKGICFHIGKLNESYPLFGNACHLSLFHDSKTPFTLEASIKNERLRTFLLMSNGVANTVLHAQLFSHLKHLRVLGLGDAGLEELVDSIDQLIYLRYLNLSHNPIASLPKSMCKLKALQTLKLRECRYLPDLPEDVTNLINLRHLEMDIRGLPPHFGKLINLQSLSAYNIVSGKRNGHGIGELKSLNCLRLLCITNINDVPNANEAKEAQLGLKTRLDKLELQWKESAAANATRKHLELAAEVLDALKPHTNLKELVIRNYCGVAYPAWLSDSSRSFTSIHLKGLNICDHLPSLGELPFLESFVITDMPCLTLVNHILYGTSAGQKFPSLKRFELRRLSNLACWEDNARYLDAMPFLERVTIDDCPNLTTLPTNIQNLLPSQHSEQSASSSNSS